MDSSELKTGDKIYIKNTEHPTNQYSSQILDILSENEYLIAGPIRRSTIVIIRPNSVIEVGYYKERIGKFTFKAEVKEVWEKGIYKLRIKRINEISKIQERNFYRFPIRLEVEKGYNPEQIYNEDNEKIEIEKCMTGDISGGGIKLFSNTEHKINDKVQLKIAIKEMIIIGIGVVVRVAEYNSNEHKRKFKYELGIKFEDIEDYQRDAIVKYIFEQERELRKKRIDYNDN